MTPYLDAGFLLNLLVPTDGSAVAHRILRRGSAPFALNFLHQLQAENLLVGLEKSDDPARQTAGLQEFLSFDPRSRAVAKAAGLRLQPERL